MPYQPERKLLSGDPSKLGPDAEAVAEAAYVVMSSRMMLHALHDIPPGSELRQIRAEFAERAQQFQARLDDLEQRLSPAAFTRARTMGYEAGMRDALVPMAEVLYNLGVQKEFS
jgi:hypothetical protein